MSNGRTLAIGDIHGGLRALQQALQRAVVTTDDLLVFLGDYVDRGRHSVETICLLLALKVKYPLRMTLLRGNHETRAITKVDPIRACALPSVCS